MKAMKRTILVGACMFALISGVSAQTGNYQEFESYQTKWKESHNVTEMTPALYERMKNDWVQSTTQKSEDRVSRDESQARTAMKESGTRLTRAEIEAQEAEIKAAQVSESRGLPADFPVKKNTGNPEADAAAYNAAKNLWIQNNPERYQQMLNGNAVRNSRSDAIRKKERNNQIR